MHENYGAAGLYVDWRRPDAKDQRLVEIPWEHFYCSSGVNQVLASVVDPRD